MNTLKSRLVDMATKAGYEIRSLQTQVADLSTRISNSVAASAIKLQTARTINGVAFDGTANISVPGSSYGVVTKTAGYTEALTSGEQLALCNLAGGFTVILPAAAANTAKLSYKKIAAAGQITISRAGSDTIDGAASAILNNQNEAITLVSDGVSNWDII